LARTVPPPPQPETRRIVTEAPPAASPTFPKPATPAKPLQIKRLVASKTALRQGIILAEILSPPIALRDE
jgi:hypothetical protein